MCASIKYFGIYPDTLKAGGMPAASRIYGMRNFRDYKDLKGQALTGGLNKMPKMP
jgi:hypothetical protein